MYDPLENDNYYEWIELYNPTNNSINISGWTISDNYVNDSIEADFDHGNGSLTILPKGYALITDHGTKFYDNYTLPNNTIKLYVDDAGIGNGLGNNGDKLVLKNNLNETIDSMEWIIEYADVVGYAAAYAGEGKSLSRHLNCDTNNSSKDFYEAMEPTPGYENKFFKYGKIQITCSQKSCFIRKYETLEIIIKVKNCGDFLDNITLKLNDITDGWNANFEKSTLSLNANKSSNVSIFVTPCNEYKNIKGEITIIAESEKKYNESGIIELSFEIFAPDLTIREIKLYNEEEFQKESFDQGEIVRIKSFLKNYGKENATDVKVDFYLDKVDSDHYIGSKYYESVGKYQKYPSIKFDTINIKPGYHKIIVVVDEENKIDELDEKNNDFSIDFQIFNTSPNTIAKKLLITELYYHSHPGLYNEFITIFNPNSKDCNISGWYITNSPNKRKTEQRRIFFPENTIIPGISSLTLSENAEKHKWETGIFPDFEYNVDSNSLIPQMNSSKKFIMNNIGCMIALKDSFNHTIDLISYGEVNVTNSCWKGNSIPSSGEGNILKRNLKEKVFFVDTNSSKDWIGDRIYKIGQSNFNFEKISFLGNVTAFVSPDNSYQTIVNELKNAYNSIYLNIYEFTSSSLCDELIDALLRNVSVSIILEGSPIGGITDKEKFLLNRIKNYRGKIRLLISNDKKDIYSRYRFNHAKYLIIDNETVIIESCNWADTGIPKISSFGNREWGVIVKNKKVANYFLKVFLDDYNPQRCDSVSFREMNFSFPLDLYMDDKVNKGIYKPKFNSMEIKNNFSIIPIFSPDNSYNEIINLIDSAKHSIFIQQLYIYKDWGKTINPFVEKLIKKSKQGIDAKVILNYNIFYDETNFKNNETKKYLEKNGIEVKYVYSNWSIFTNVHNKGVIVDNKSVLISSVNWNENSVLNNREAGIIIENEKIATYFADVFFYDWELNMQDKQEIKIETAEDNKNTIYIVIIFTMTFALIARDWRKRKWT